MTSPRKYFHDRFVLLMLGINTFLAFATVASVAFRLGDTSKSYIASYQQNLGLSAYSIGGASELISFAVFALTVLVGQLFISLHLHHIRKHAAWAIMLMAALLLILALLVSNSLLRLR